MKNSKSKLINTIDRTPAVQEAFMNHSEDEIDREDVISAVIAAYEAHQRDKMLKVREKLATIKLAAQTADGWKDGETFYRSIIEAINTDSIEALEWLNIHARSGEGELRDSFAIAALPAHMEAIYKAKIGIETWHEDAAALAYATADAMMVERAKP